jgi:hypothetical protein
MCGEQNQEGSKTNCRRHHLKKVVLSFFQLRNLRPSHLNKITGILSWVRQQYIISGRVNAHGKEQIH